MDISGNGRNLEKYSRGGRAKDGKAKVGRVK